MAARRTRTLRTVLPVFLLALGGLAYGAARPGHAAELRGRVVSRAGQAVAHAWVEIADCAGDSGSSRDAPSCAEAVGRHVLTDSLGRFAFAGLPDHAGYSLVVGADGFHGAFEGPFDPAGQAGEAVLRLVPQDLDAYHVAAANRLVVHVTDPDGMPLGAVQVFVRQKFDVPQPIDFRDGDSTTAIGYPSQFTGTSGDAISPINRSGRYQVEAVASGYAPSVARDVTGPADRPLRCTIRMARGATLAGSVRGMPGVAGQGMVLELRRLDDARFTEMPAVDVDSAGHWRAERLTPGSRYAIFAPATLNPARGTSHAVVAGTGADGSTSDAAPLEGVPAYTVRGRLVPPRGQPLPRGARLFARRSLALAGQETTEEEAFEVPIDASGGFAFSGVPAVAIELRPLADGLMPRPAGTARLRWSAKGACYELHVHGDVGDLEIPLMPAPPPHRDPGDDTTPG